MLGSRGPTIFNMRGRIMKKVCRKSNGETEGPLSEGGVSIMVRNDSSSYSSSCSKYPGDPGVVMETGVELDDHTGEEYVSLMLPPRWMSK